VASAPSPRREGRARRRQPAQSRPDLHPETPPPRDRPHAQTAGRFAVL